MSIYYISGIWTNKNDVVTHLNLHEVADGTMGKAKKYTIEQVAKATESHKIYTANWNYSKRKWKRGARVHVVEEANYYYLRSNHDGVESDNLDNMLPMGNLGC